jgi:AraC-like DNA-binding protein
MSDPGFRSRAAAWPLRPAVDALWGHRGSGGGTQRVLPDGCMDILVRRPLTAHGEPAGPWRAVLVGAMTRALLAGGDAEIVGVRFRPGEATRFLPFPAEEAADLTVDLDQIAAPLARDLEESVTRAEGFAARFAALEGLLLGRLDGASPADFRLRRAIARLGEGPRSIGQLAGEVGLGPRQLHRLCVQRVGVGPGLLGRVLRMQRAVRLGEEQPDLGWSGVASAAGYCDQPHLNREFQALVGVSPARYLGERGGAMSEGSKPEDGSDRRRTA